MRTSLAERLAAVYSVVKYAAEPEMSTLDALLAAAKAGERTGDYLPHAVLADHLEENPQHAISPAFTQRLRDGVQKGTRVHAWKRNDGKVGGHTDASLGLLAYATFPDARFDYVEDEHSAFGDAAEPYRLVFDHPPVSSDGEEVGPAQHFGTVEQFLSHVRVGDAFAHPWEGIRDYSTDE